MNAPAAVLAALLGLWLGSVQAAPPDRLLQSAGPVPTDAGVQAALRRYLLARDRSFDNRKPFKILSGPTLATGTTFAGGIEQAWLMCVVVNEQKTSPGPTGIEGKSLYLRRNAAGEVVVVPIDNWKDSSPQCGGAQ
ncbi:MAG: hypothetical protein JWQ72_3769 [Polaromonas sp.]|nr:hypothetical protein [Polaromonas sp.]